MCDVSRTPIREALRRLEQDGLVHHGDHGLIVRRRSPEEILDIYETRIVLEATAARVAADRRTDHDLLILGQLLKRSEQVAEDDAVAMVTANQRFHRMIWRSAHNESLLDLLERINLHLSRYPGTTLAVPGRWQQALHQHRSIVDAIQGRDKEGAYLVTQSHFADAREIRLQLFADEALLDLAP
jgi:DNA-binding GntR family transcriptional regulator